MLLRWLHYEWVRSVLCLRYIYVRDCGYVIVFFFFERRGRERSCSRVGGAGSGLKEANIKERGGGGRVAVKKQM